MILPILTEENPILREESEPVKVFDNDLNTIINNMLETVKINKGCGLAAVQCGILKQIVLISEDGKRFKVLINPIILEQKGSQLSKERCLSVRKVCLVERPTEMTIQYQNKYGNIERLIAKDFLACVASHELDHTLGVLISDKDKNND